MSEERLLQLVDNASSMELDADALEDLKCRIMQARTITYLTDNCGEVVLDKLLIAQIRLANPQARVTAVVRGAETSNDATMADALQVGLDTVCRVIDNGSDIAGTCPTQNNDETRAALGTRISQGLRGLANYEAAFRAAAPTSTSLFL